MGVARAWLIGGTGGRDPRPHRVDGASTESAKLALLRGLARRRASKLSEVLPILLPSTHRTEAAAAPRPSACTAHRPRLRRAARRWRGSAAGRDADGPARSPWHNEGRRRSARAKGSHSGSSRTSRSNGPRRRSASSASDSSGSVGLHSRGGVASAIRSAGAARRRVDRRWFAITLRAVASATLAQHPHEGRRPGAARL
jgi:hypothetical protein